MSDNKEGKSVNKIGPMMKELYEQKQRQETVQTYWEGLETVYFSCAESIISVLETLKELQQKIGLHIGNDKIKEQNILINGLLSDMQHFTDKLVAVRQRHEGKKGKVVTDEEFIESVAIGQEYHAFSIEFNSLVTPTMLSIIENIASALGESTEPPKPKEDQVLEPELVEKQQTNLTNSSDVVDAEFTEVKE